MKRILFGTLMLLLISAPLLAQTKISKRDIQRATDEIATIYQLDATQKQEVYQIQERRLHNLAEVEKLKSTDYDLYVRKRHAVRIGTDHAIRQLLNEAQLKIYEARQKDLREREVERMRELKRQGASDAEIKKALLEIE